MYLWKHEYVHRYMYVCSKEKKRPWFEREKRGIYVRVLEEERQLVNGIIKYTKNILKKTQGERKKIGTLLKWKPLHEIEKILHMTESQKLKQERIHKLKQPLK